MRYRKRRSERVEEHFYCTFLFLYPGTATPENTTAFPEEIVVINWCARITTACHEETTQVEEIIFL